MIPGSDARSTILSRQGIFVLTLVAVVLPLWTVRYLPGTDLPSHLAIANILAKLLTNDPIVSSYYAINIQPVPYYVVYAVLAPLVALFGPFIAAKLFFSGVSVATVLAARRLFAAVEAPWWAVSSSFFFIYGMNFFWGFLPTLVGVPVFVFGVAELVRHVRFGGRRAFYTAVAVSLVLTLTHIALIIPWACALVAMWFTRERRVIRASISIGIASAVPLLPFIAFRLLNRHSGYATSVQYEDVATVGKHVVQQFGVFDRGLGLLTHVAFIGVAALLGLRRQRAGRIDAATTRMMRAFAALAAIAYLVTPMAMDAGGDFIWAFNVRLFFAAEIGLLALLTLDRSGPPNLIEGLQPLIVSAHAVAMLVFFFAFDTHVRTSEAVIAAIPEGATIAVASKDGRFGDAWAPQTLHIHGYYLAGRRGYDGAVFAGKHIPITALNTMCPGNMASPKQTECDYLWAEGSSVEPALRDCTPVAVVAGFALVRDCKDQSRRTPEEVVAHEPLAPRGDDTTVTDGLGPPVL